MGEGERKELASGMCSITSDLEEEKIERKCWVCTVQYSKDEWEVCLPAFLLELLFDCSFHKDEDYNYLGVIS